MSTDNFSSNVFLLDQFFLNKFTSQVKIGKDTWSELKLIKVWICKTWKTINAYFESGIKSILPHKFQPLKFRARLW